MAGWICLYRDIQDHWLFNFDEPDKFMAWCDLLMLANIEDKKFKLKGQLVECHRGQVGLSQVSLAKRWKWSRSKVIRFLYLLEKEGMISTKSGHLNTTITICNYSKFQDVRASGDTAGDTAGDTRLNKLTSKQTDKETTNVVSSCAEPHSSTPQHAKKNPAMDCLSRSGITGIGAGEKTQTAIELPLNVSGETHAVTQDEVALWSGIYPAVDVPQALRAMLGWLIANPSKRKTKSGIKKFINAWLAKEQNQNPQKSPGDRTSQNRGYTKNNGANLTHEDFTDKHYGQSTVSLPWESGN